MDTPARFATSFNVAIETPLLFYNAGNCQTKKSGISGTKGCLYFDSVYSLPRKTGKVNVLVKRLNKEKNHAVILEYRCL